MPRAKPVATAKIPSEPTFSRRSYVPSLKRTSAGNLGGPNDPTAHGRFDHGGEVFYVGAHGIFDANRHVLVIDWRTKHGAIYEQATVTDPHGVTLKA